MSTGKLKTWTAIAEIASAVAVVLSLVYVGYEIRQSTNAIAAQAIFELNESGRETLLLQVADEELSRMLMKARIDRALLTDVEWYRFTRHVWALTNTYESAWIYHDRGLIGDSAFRGFQTSYCENMKIPAYREAMNVTSSHTAEFSADLKSWCSD